MKVTIITDNDLYQLIGKFIVLVNKERDNHSGIDFWDSIIPQWGENEKNKWEYLKMKRIALVGKYRLIDLYGNTREFANIEIMKEKINCEDKSRYFRLLSKEELEYMFKKLVEDRF